MDGIIFYNGEAINGEQLNELQERKATSIKNRFTDTHTAGVVNIKSPENIVYTDGRTLGIYALVAYDNKGERIEVLPNENPILPAISGLLPNEHGELIQGGTDLTPQARYTLVITYAEVKAPPVEHHVTTGIPFLTRNNSSYKLWLRPSESPQEGDVVLANISVDADGNVTIDESVRSISSVPPTTVVSTINVPEGQQGSGNYGSNVTFVDHINSLGTGQVTSRNPHGMSPSDIGIDIGALADHQKLLHSDGIRSDNLGSVYSALYPSYRKETLTNYEVVYIQRLDAALNEIVVINGESITPSEISATYSFSFEGYAIPEKVGYYLFSYDGPNRQFVVNGPFADESDSSFLRLLETSSLFPICSFKWDYVTYDVTGDDQDDVGSYNIIPATFKDRRVFNNTSLKTLRPDEVFAWTQFAPVANDTAFLHNARIIGKTSQPSYYVAQRTLNVQVNYKDTMTVTFQGLNPIPMESVIDQILTAATRIDEAGDAYLLVYPRITEDGCLSLSATNNISIIPAASNGAEAFFGFTAANGNLVDDTSGLIKELIYFGDRNGIVLFNYNKDGDVSSIDYYLGGGVVRRNEFVYDGGYITKVKEIVKSL